MKNGLRKLMEDRKETGIETITTTMSKKLKERLKEQSVLSGISISRIMETLAYDFVEEMEKHTGEDFV